MAPQSRDAWLCFDTHKARGAPTHQQGKAEKRDGGNTLSPLRRRVGVDRGFPCFARSSGFPTPRHVQKQRSRPVLTPHPKKKNLCGWPCVRGLGWNNGFISAHTYPTTTLMPTRRRRPKEAPHSPLLPSFCLLGCDAQTAWGRAARSPEGRLRGTPPIRHTHAHRERKWAMSDMGRGGGRCPVIRAYLGEEKNSCFRGSDLVAK